MSGFLLFQWYMNSNVYEYGLNVLRLVVVNFVSRSDIQEQNFFKCMAEILTLSEFDFCAAFVLVII